MIIASLLRRASGALRDLIARPPARAANRVRGISAGYAPLSLRLSLVLSLLPAPVHAETIGVVGVFPGKAVLVIDGAAPKTYSVGSVVAPAIRLLGVSDAGAVLEDHGKRQMLPIGAHFSRARKNDNASITLRADSRGHFLTPVQINGLSISMLVDTGATLVMLPADDARRMGIDYQRGLRVTVATANGRVPAYQVRLDAVRVGDIELSQVDSLVQENGLNVGLLGMSFLNRTQLRRDGDEMVLTKRF